MRLLLSALLLSAVTFSAQAEPQPAKVDSATIVKAGVMKFGDTPEVINDGKISTGQRTTAQDVQVTDETTTIPLSLNRVFGLEFKLAGTPADGRARLRVVWRYPNDGIKSPGGKSKYSDAYEDTFNIGSTEALYWYLGASYTLVPGRWTVELWDGERRLLSADFNLGKPSAGDGVSVESKKPDDSTPANVEAPDAAETSPGTDAGNAARTPQPTTTPAPSAPADIKPAAPAATPAPDAGNDAGNAAGASTTPSEPAAPAPQP